MTIFLPTNDAHLTIPAGLDRRSLAGATSPLSEASAGAHCQLTMVIA
jgi:hypothetical protein